MMNADDPADMRYPIRNEDNQIVTIQTDFGDLVLELYADVAPGHADSFVARSAEGFYDGLIFHRIIDGFMIQGGDPQGTGMGNAGYFLTSEFSDIKHVEGTLSMARSRDVHSASSQFFVCLGPAPQLNGQYTVFGQLIKGYDVLRELGKVEVMAPPNNPREKSKPVETVHMRKVFLSNAEGEPLTEGEPLEGE
jgi:cyclophilin family peptidyl-prolyl cis-trans isomerase